MFEMALLQLRLAALMGRKSSLRAKDHSDEPGRQIKRTGHPPIRAIRNGRGRQGPGAGAEHRVAIGAPEDRALEAGRQGWRRWCSAQDATTSLLQPIQAAVVPPEQQQ